MKKIILFFLIILSTIQSSYADWFLQNSGTTNYLNDVKFINANTGYVGADGGILLKTTNGGDNWISISLGGISDHISSVFFLDVNNIIFADYNGNVYKTTDGGIIFNSIPTFIYGATSIFFPSKDTGYMNSKYAGVFKTIDGGINWFNVFQTTDQMQGELFFFNNQTGFATGGGNTYTILKTTNGGGAWKHLSPNYSDYIFDIQFVNNLTGYCAGIQTGGQGAIYKSMNGGTIWDRQIITPDYVTSISFADENTGYAASYSNIAKTTNGGLNWILENNPVLFQRLIRLDFVNALTGYAVSANGKIIKTTDGGTVGIQTLSNEIPEKYFLYQNYPNPFNPGTNLEFEIPASRQGGSDLGFVSLKIYDILGNEIATLVKERKAPGKYSVTFDGSNFSSGVYYYKLTTGEFTQTRKMILLK